jgi:hypothetical protein
MNGLWDFCQPRRRRDKIVLVVTLAGALLLVAAATTGCGSAKVKGVHGTGIAYLKVNPGNRTLHQGMVSTVRLTANIAFVVGVENGGQFLERNVKVTLLIDQKPQPIRRSLTIKQIRRGAKQVVVFKPPFSLTELANMVPIKVNVAPVRGETNLVNNSATYKVRFSF